MAGISVESISKRYRSYAQDRPRTFQETLLRGFRGLGAQGSFWALRDVSLQVASGEMVGVIGRNGAGKSTLLRLVGGIGQPDSGSIRVAGRTGALIDLGAGFHPDLTGRENAVLNGVISGLSRRQVNGLMDSIVAFAELENFLDNPVRTYSSGMQLRLAFSVAVHVQPEVLLVDEVLAVGDLGFQRKCLERIRQLRDGGAAVLYVTHDLSQARDECDRVLWLDGGQAAAWGAAAEVVDAYRETMQRITRQRTPLHHPDEAAPGGMLRVNENRFGSLEVQLRNVRLQGAGAPGAGLEVVMDWQAQPAPGKPVLFSVGLHRADGLLLVEMFSEPSLLPGERGHLRLDFERLDLASGDYYVDVGVYPADWSYAYDYHWRAYPFSVEGAGEGKGPLRPPARWTISIDA